MSAASAKAAAVRHQLSTVQWLRAVAAMLVMLFHTSQGVEFRTGVLTSRWTDFGACGVDIFFVISGFIMTVTSAGKNFRLGDFLIKRVLRIAPIYWLFTLLKAMSLLLIPSLVLFSVFSIRNIVTSLLLVPYDTPGRGVVPLIIVAWSLELEIMFYLVFGLCRSLLPRQWVTAITLIFLATMAAYVLGPANYVIGFYARPVIFEFLFGILLGRLFLSDRLPQKRVCLAMVAIASASLLILPQGTESTRFLLWGLPSAALVLGMVAIEKHYRLWRWPVMTLIGDSSYSLYLTHTLAVPFIMLPLHYLHPGLIGSYIYLVPMLVLQVLIGCMTFRFVEKPVTLLLQRRYKAWTAVGALHAQKFAR